MPAVGKRSFPDRGLARINARGLDPDKDLPRPRGWAVDFYHLQNFEPTILIESHCTRHSISPFKSNTASRFPSTAPRFAKLIGSVWGLCRSSSLLNRPLSDRTVSSSGNQQ